MPAKKISCRVIDKTWMTPSVIRIRFMPEKKFAYEAGQFISVLIRPPGMAPVKRLYSLACAPEEAKTQGYELCVKYVAGGIGSEFLSSLKLGDTFDILAPYGDFRFKSRMGRSVCVIATGTGLAPLIAMLRSQAFRHTLPKNTLCLIGSRSEDEILYRGVLEAMKIETVNAVSQPGPDWVGFHGRVTDYLRQLPSDWNWHDTDFYLCGNASMIGEAKQILRGGHGVDPKAIHYEVFSPGRPAQLQPVKAPKLFPFQLPFFKPSA